LDEENDDEKASFFVLTVSDACIDRVLATFRRLKAPLRNGAMHTLLQRDRTYQPRGLDRLESQV
jgi:hypothetical protein